MHNYDSLKIVPVSCHYYNSYKLSFYDDTKTKMTHYEMDIITSGRAHLVIDKTTYIFHPGEICFRKPGQVNVSLLDTPYECLHLQFDVVNNSNAKNFLNDIPTFIAKENSREIRDATFSFHKYYCYKSEYNSIMCDAMLTTLKAALYKEVHKDDIDKATIYHTTIQKAIDYMKKNIDMQIKIEELAKYCGYSAKHFQKLFKEATGITPHQYLLNIRIDLAKEQLITTSTPIGKISLECGFFDSNYFTEAFKKHTGITPRAFRNKSI